MATVVEHDKRKQEILEKSLDVFEMQNLTTKEKIEEDKEEVERTVIKEPTQISLLEIDDELKKVDDMLNL